MLRVGVDSGLFRRNLDLDAEATRLHVLLDGLAFHLIGGGGTSTDLARELLTEHLAERTRR